MPIAGTFCFMPTAMPVAVPPISAVSESAPQASELGPHAASGPTVTPKRIFQQVKPQLDAQNKRVVQTIAEASGINTVAFRTSYKHIKKDSEDCLEPNFFVCPPFFSIFFHAGCYSSDWSAHPEEIQGPV